jgi:hypothetical protein
VLKFKRKFRRLKDNKPRGCAACLYEAVKVTFASVSITDLLLADNIISFFLTIYLICLMKISVKLCQVAKQMRNICVQGDITG